QILQLRHQRHSVPRHALAGLALRRAVEQAVKAGTRAGDLQEGGTVPERQIIDVRTIADQSAVERVGGVDTFAALERQDLEVMADAENPECELLLVRR